MSRSVTLLIAACVVGLLVAFFFSFTLLGLLGVVVAIAAAAALVARLTLRARHR
jgi:hypothetical protein